MSVRIAVDSNVLIYAFATSARDHVVVREWLEAKLADARATVVLTTSVISEMLHVVTDPRRFDPPVAMNDATTLMRDYLDKRNVELILTDERAIDLALNLIDRLRLGRNRVNDTLLAATCLAHGITELATCNPADFRIFPGLKLVDPTE